MKKLIAKIIHCFNPEYFVGASYARLERWGVYDVIEGHLLFEDERPT